MVDYLCNELPPIMDISHMVDFILGSSLPNKVAYRLTPQENEEVRRQVQGLLDKGLVHKSLSGGCVLTPEQLTRLLSDIGFHYQG